MGWRFDELETPAPLVDLDRMEANLDRMAAYARAHGLALRPHIKTHKTPELAREQIRRGARGVTCATALETEVMSGVARDVLVAFPPVDPRRLSRLLAVDDDVLLTMALDSHEAVRALSAAATRVGRTIGVLVEVDAGMRRVGVAEPDAAVALAREASELPGVRYRGLMFYPGHIREPLEKRDAAMDALSERLGRFLVALERAGLTPEIVSGGSTPTAWSSHRVAGQTEIRPGTYIFNDRTSAAVGACAWDDCAYSVLATVVSTAVPGQAVVDAGAKALAREQIRGVDAPGLGALLEHPDVLVTGMSEEHGILDLTATDWRPRVGDRVRIVPNHVCVSVNLHDTLWAVRDGDVVTSWDVAARGH